MIVKVDVSLEAINRNKKANVSEFEDRVRKAVARVFAGKGNGDILYVKDIIDATGCYTRLHSKSRTLFSRNVEVGKHDRVVLGELSVEYRSLCL